MVRAVETISSVSTEVVPADWDSRTSMVHVVRKYLKTRVNEPIRDIKNVGTPTYHHNLR